MLNLLKSKKKDPGKELKSLFGDFELPSFNSTVMNVLRLLRDPESSIKDIGDQVRIDPGIHIKILQTVNSAAYGLASKISNIQHAVSLLGRSRLESIILSVAIKDSLPGTIFPYLSESRFWATSTKRASLAGALATHLHPTTKTESFTAAFLQDMAMPILMNKNKEKYSQILKNWFSNKESMLYEIEKDVLGYDHAYVGALMAEEWNLPEYLVNAVKGHHNDKENENVDPAVKLVSHLRYDDEDEIYVFKEKCVSEYHIEEQLIDEIMNKALDDAKHFMM